MLPNRRVASSVSGCSSKQVVVTTIAPKPVPRALTRLPRLPQCLKRGPTDYSVPEVEASRACWRRDSKDVRGRFVKLRNAVRSRERLAAKAKKAGI